MGNEAEDLSRRPPADVLRQLRKSVGFGCPVPDCGNPFLEYHHFDPEWSVEHHHRPEGMIPLCPSHHAKAAAWSVEQLREMKAAAFEASADVSGRFEWMQQRYFAVIGGTIYLDVPVAIAVDGTPAVWWQRDEQGRALLGVRMITSPELVHERLRMDANNFLAKGEPVDLRCPPSGRLLSVSYPNGDALSIEYRRFASIDEVAARYPDEGGSQRMASFSEDIGAADWPLVGVEIHMKVASMGWEFTPSKTSVGAIITHGLIVGGPIGFNISH